MNIREKFEARTLLSKSQREAKRRFWNIAACVAVALYALAGLFTVWVLRE